MENAKISVKQFTILVVMNTLGSSVLVVPSMLATYAKSNAWISSLLGLTVGLLCILLYVKISTVYPDKTLVEINQEVFGKWIGNLLSLLFLIPVFILAAGNLIEIGNFFTTQILVETPIHAILILTLLAVIYVIRKGIEVMARTCEIFFPWTVFFLFILILFLIREIKMENLVPNFAKGMGPILGVTYPHVMIPYSQLVVMLFIFPFVNHAAKARMGFFMGVIMGGLVITIIVVMCLGVLGADFTARSAFPTYILGKKISIGGFLERIEVVVAFSWILSIFFKLLINTFALLLGITQILKLNDFRVLSFPFGFLLMVYSMVNNPNVIFLKQTILSTWPAFLLTLFIILPFFVLIGAKIKRKFQIDTS